MLVANYVVEMTTDILIKSFSVQMSQSIHVPLKYSDISRNLQFLIFTLIYICFGMYHKYFVLNCHCIASSLNYFFV